jgi:dihydropteroate synthase-like protein
MTPRRINFITGKLAAPALATLLKDMAPSFGHKVVELPAHVAALMTTEYIARKLPPGLTGEVMIPGGCQGPLDPIRLASGAPALRGPVDMMDIPAHFGGKLIPPKYGKPRLHILAEIVDAPKLSIRQIVLRAGRYAKDGADWIDLGCMNETPFPHLADTVRELCGMGYKVSVDSANPDELLAGSRAGAGMFLSVNSANISIAGKLEGKVVVIPDPGKGIGGMYKNAEAALRQGVEVVLDPILDPLMMGAAKAVARYVDARRKFPDTPILMGAGNLVELVEADNLGINAMIAGFCAEMNIDYALTAEVIPWNRGAVAQLAAARRVMEYAKERKTLPKGFDHRLVALRDPKIRGFTAAQIGKLQKMVNDKNFRIFVADEKIHIFNREVYIKAGKAEGMIGKLGVEDAAHAFYLGMELMKAETALLLGKNYVQDEPLAWGYITAGRPKRRDGGRAK